MRKIYDSTRLSIAQKKFDVDGFYKVIDEAYWKTEGRELSDRQKVSFAPSGIGYGSGTCARRWYYDFTGGDIRQETSDTMSLANMAYGTSAHARLQNIFAESGILVAEEEEIINEDPPIRGFADLVVNWQGEDVVGEIKTTTQESYVAKKSKNKPAPYHLLQVLIYMKVLGFKTGFLLYENKNTQEIFVIPVYMNEANENLINYVFGWMRKVYANWEDNTLPTRPYTQKSIACKSCPFSTHCWNDEDGTVSIERLDVPK